PDVSERVKKLMVSLRSEFGGPEFEPHVTVVGAIRLTEDEAREKLIKACEGLKVYNATVEKVETGTFFYQCVFLLLHKAPQFDSVFHKTGNYAFFDRTGPDPDTDRQIGSGVWDKIGFRSGPVFRL
nr:cyclic phosphodiesterase-like [Tanacetum cinerariifolium]